MLATRIPSPHGTRTPTHLAFRPTTYSADGSGSASGSRTQTHRHRGLLMTVASGNKMVKFFGVVGEGAGEVGLGLGIDGTGAGSRTAPTPSTSTSTHEQSSWQEVWRVMWRNLEATACAWSEDGSVAAVAWKGGAVTLWDPDSKALLGVVGSETLRKSYSGLMFVDDDRAVVCWGDHEVDCFDAAGGALGTGWKAGRDGEMRQRIVGVVRDGGRGLVVCVQGKKKTTFQWLEEGRDLKARASVVVEEPCLAFTVMKWMGPAGSVDSTQQQTGQVVYLDRQGTLRLIAQGKVADAWLGAGADAEAEGPQKNVLEAVFGSGMGRGISGRKLDWSTRNVAKSADPLGNLPAHIIPSITALFEEVMSGMMARAPGADEEDAATGTVTVAMEGEGQSTAMAVDESEPPTERLEQSMWTRGGSRRSDDRPPPPEDFSFLDAVFRPDGVGGTKVNGENVKKGVGKKGTTSTGTNKSFTATKTAKKVSKRHANLSSLFLAGPNGHTPPDSANGTLSSSSDNDSSDSDYQSTLENGNEEEGGGLIRGKRRHPA
ncbi:hypothetical protein HDU93_001885 [Gonapodya sp. JEL0774]|nr:hypothetical protein HDU93_001885 [Gonapodya sp. JEL0774]